MVQGLRFHPDAFAFVSADMPARLDVLYGFASFAPSFGARFRSENDPSRLLTHERVFDPARLPL